jgi:hypothetical protein
MLRSELTRSSSSAMQQSLSVTQHAPSATSLESSGMSPRLRCRHCAQHWRHCALHWRLPSRTGIAGRRSSRRDGDGGSYPRPSYSLPPAENLLGCRLRLRMASLPPGDDDPLAPGTLDLAAIDAGPAELAGCGGSTRAPAELGWYLAGELWPRSGIGRPSLGLVADP